MTPKKLVLHFALGRDNISVHDRLYRTGPGHGGPGSGESPSFLNRRAVSKLWRGLDAGAHHCNNSCGSAQLDAALLAGRSGSAGGRNHVV